LRQTLEIQILGAWALPSLSNLSISSRTEYVGTNDASSAFTLFPTSSVFCTFTIWGENCDSQRHKTKLVNSSYMKSVNTLSSFDLPDTLSSSTLTSSIVSSLIPVETKTISCPAPFWNETFHFPLTSPDVAILYVTVHEVPLQSFGSSLGVGGGSTTSINSTILNTATTFQDSDDASFLAYFAAPISCLHTGYRCLPLRDAKGKKFGALSSLLCRFKLL